MAGPVGTWLRKYAFAPRYRRAHRISLTTADGVPLWAAALPGPDGAEIGVVLVHGFANWSRTPVVHAFAHELARWAPVVVPDLRGHGRSAGRCTFGAAEPLDVAAAAAALPPGLPLLTVGTSLGGAAVILHAARARAGAERHLLGTVAISAPGWWGDASRPGSARIKRSMDSRSARWAMAALLRTRLGRAVERAPTPRSVVGAIAPAFTVMVHDPTDAYFGPEHAEALYDRAGEPKELWWYKGGGHGVELLTPALAERIGVYARDQVARTAQVSPTDQAPS